MSKTLLSLSILILPLLFQSTTTSVALAQQCESIPNIIIFITDDQRYDDFTPTLMPELHRRMSRGTIFSRAYVTTPACCPSRASIFTGQYTSQHGVRENDYVLQKPTMFERLRETGIFYTGLIGKYLNTWNGRPRPEFDFWVSFPGGSTRYYKPFLNVNGRWKLERGYVTYRFRDYALQFISAAVAQPRPFLLVMPLSAPHYPFSPAKEDRRLYEDIPVPRLPSFDELDRSDKPIWLRRLKRRPASRLAAYAGARKKQWRALRSVDRALESIIADLEQRGILDNTAIFFLSDNGLLSGEHGIGSKDVVYEEAIHVPFALRYPRCLSPGAREDLVANIDIAPTVFDLANLPIPADMAGTSLMQLDKKDVSWRKELLIEGFRGRVVRSPFAAVHTGRYVYVRNQAGSRGPAADFIELYDLETDPYQLENLVGSAQHIGKLKELDGALTSMLMRYRGANSFSRPRGKRGRTHFPPLKALEREKLRK